MQPAWLPPHEDNIEKPEHPADFKRALRRALGGTRDACVTAALAAILASLKTLDPLDLVHRGLGCL